MDITHDRRAMSLEQNYFENTKWTARITAPKREKVNCGIEAMNIDYQVSELNDLKSVLF